MKLVLAVFVLWRFAAVVTGEEQHTKGAAFPSATICEGVVVGTTTMLPSATAAVNKFLGIPFAQSPPERFSPPKPPSSWKQHLIAQKLKPACIQQFKGAKGSFQRNATMQLFNEPPPAAGESEDCLYINVYAPSSPAPPGGRAVMFWIFGGGYMFGTGSLPTYDGSAFAAYQDVILVTHNYRTNVFGWSNSPQIQVDQMNAGLYDQRLALNWVQNNIAAFGGDPTRVTIFGESAGAVSVDALINTHTTENAPFHAAILQSGQSSYLPLPNAANSSGWEQLVSALKCNKADPLACVRAASAHTIKSIIEEQSLSFLPVPHEATFPTDGAAHRSFGRFAAVPMLIGSNSGDGRPFTVQNFLENTSVHDYLETRLGPLASKLGPALEAAFPVKAPESAYDVIAELYTLQSFQCPAALLANESAAIGVPTWLYQYNASFPNLSPFYGLLRAWHSSEIQLVFQTYPGGPIQPVTSKPAGLLPYNVEPTAQEFALSQFLSESWATFAKNPMYGPGWNRVGSFLWYDIAIIGTDGSSGVEMVYRETINGKCQALLPLFRAVNGPAYGLPA